MSKVDEVAKVIVDGLQLKTSVGFHERELARKVIACFPPSLEDRIGRLERIVAHLCPDRSDDV